jgi:outer membrane biosynthesis protein TonB
VPHLSVASASGQRELDRIAHEFAQAARDVLPIKATVREVSLLERRKGRWQVRTAFELGRA